MPPQAELPHIDSHSAVVSSVRSDDTEAVAGRPTLGLGRASKLRLVVAYFGSPECCATLLGTLSSGGHDAKTVRIIGGGQALAKLWIAAASTGAWLDRAMLVEAPEGGLSFAAEAQDVDSDFIAMLSASLARMPKGGELWQGMWRTDMVAAFDRAIANGSVVVVITARSTAEQRDLVRKVLKCRCAAVHAHEIVLPAAAGAPPTSHVTAFQKS